MLSNDVYLKQSENNKQFILQKGELHMVLNGSKVKFPIAFSITAVDGKFREVLTLSAELMLHQEKEVFESLGFKFEDIENESCHQIILPDKWQFNSEPIGRYCLGILDKEKRIRAILDLHDRDKIILSLLTRYSLMDRYIDDEEKELGIFAIDYDDTELYYAGSYENKRRYSHIFDHLTRKAENYLSEHFPDWEDPTKYWD